MPWRSVGPMLVYAVGGSKRPELATNYRHPMIVNGNKKSQLLGTAQDDVFYPSGNVYQELTLNPGNDIYSLGDSSGINYDFYLTPVNYYTSTGARINLGTGTVTLGGVSLKPNTISDGYGGIDTVTYSKDSNNYSLRIHSGQYDDYLNTVGSNLWVEWRLSPGAGNDSITAKRGSVYVTGAVNLDVNFSGLNGRVQLDPSTSLTYNYSSLMNWEFDGPIGSNKIINNAPNTYIIFLLDAGLTIGNQTVSSSGNNNIQIVFRNYVNASIDISGISGVMQVDSKTSLTYKVDQGQSIDWVFSSFNYKVNGSLENERFTLDWGSTTTISGGGGADTFYINRNMVSAQINDYNFEDKLVFNILETNDKATFAKSVTITQNKANYTTILAFAASSVAPAANVVVNGWYSNYQFNSDGAVQLIPLLPNDPKNASLFAGNYLNTTSGGAANNTILYLNNVQELLSFPIQSVTTPDQVYYFDTGYDLVHLWRTDNVLGGAASYRLTPTNFRSASGASAPTTPTEYVIYDTSTGNLYFDQDGTGPSPTVLAATFVDKPALKYTDFNTSVPQTYALSAGQDKVNRGQSATFTLSTTNVPSGTAVPYTLTGVAAADVTGGQLSGTALVDSSGKATISVPLAASGSQGAKTLNISAGGQSASVSVADTVSAPTYALTASSSSVNEGATATFTLTTTNLSVGTSVAYTLSGTGITASDIVGGQLTGTVTIGANGQTTIPIALTADQITEGAETLKITVGSAVGSIVINDTSITPTAPNTYYGTAGNDVIDGNTLPTDVNYIDAGLGDDNVTLRRGSDQQYIAGPGNNTIIGNGSSTIVYYNAAQPININLSTGLSSNNGYGGVDKISGINSIHTGPAGGNIVGDQNNNAFWMLSNNNTVTGGGGYDSIIYWTVKESEISLTYNADGTIVAKNIANNGINYFSGIGVIQFLDALLDVSNIKKIQTYRQSPLNLYNFAGTPVSITISTTNVTSGTDLNWSISSASPSINNNSTVGTSKIGANGNAVVIIPTAINIIKSESVNFNFSINGGPGSQYASSLINLIPKAIVSTSTPQVNTGAVETFTISTQLPAGEKFDYTLSGVGQGDVPTVPLTGTLTSDANGSATLTVPLASRSNFAGNQTMTLTAGGTTSSVAIVDKGNKNSITYYAQLNEVVDYTKLPSNIVWVQGAGNNKLNLGTLSYAASPGNNTVFTNNQYSFGGLPKGSVGSIDMSKGIVLNNGYGGSDAISGNYNVAAGPAGTSTYIVGDTNNSLFLLGAGGNTTLDGGGGLDTVFFGGQPFANWSYSIVGNSLSLTNKLTQENDLISNVGNLGFSDRIINVANINSIQTYFNPAKLSSYYFTGTIIPISIQTQNVADGTKVPWNLYVPSDNYSVFASDVKNSIAMVKADLLSFDIPIKSGITIPTKISLNLNIFSRGTFSIGGNSYFDFTILPAAKLTPSASQINTGSVETFTISTQLPAGEKLDYTLSGITTSDTTLSSLTGTLTADANGTAALIVPLLARSNYQGDKTLTLTAGGSTSTVKVVDSFVKQLNVYYGTGGDDTIDGSKLPANIQTINPRCG